MAELSGVSRSTVAAVLSGGGARYSAETCRKVLAAAKQLNYRPSRAAQVMRNQRSNYVAIVHFGAGIESAQKTNLGLSRQLNAAGYDYLAMDMDWHGGGVERTLEELIQARVEGVLISHIQEVFEEKHIESLRRFGIPVVAINGEQRSGVPLLCHDLKKAFEDLTCHLLDNGHRLILNMTSDDLDLAGERARAISHRVLGFRRAMERAGTWMILSEEDFLQQWPTLPRDKVLGITVTQKKVLYTQLENPVYQFCQRLFPTKKLPDAIVCPNDAVAMEAILAAQEWGLGVPRDFAVTGYDNDRIGAFPALGLTTAEQDIENICVQSVETLLSLIRDPHQKMKGKVFPSKLILRTSSGRPQAGKLRKKC